MEVYPKISIVTPNYNQSGYLEQTIRSVLDQGYPNLEYIIVDGGSTDGSVEIIRKYAHKLAWWISEKDEGMYHAIQKGFDKSTGEIMGWINSDDLLHQKSLFVLAKCFSKPAVNWVQGLNTVVNSEGFVIATCKPYNTIRYNFLLYDHLRKGTIRSFGTLQQESTYWRRSLWEKAGGLDLKYAYAGDFALWMKFFRYERMFLVDSLIGAFRTRPDQLSQKRIIEYVEETRQCIDEEVLQLDPGEKTRLILLQLLWKLRFPPLLLRRIMGRQGRALHVSLKN